MDTTKLHNSCKIETNSASVAEKCRKKEDRKKGKIKKEQQAINEDILFLCGMKTCRVAHYSTKVVESVKAAEARSFC